MRWIKVWALALVTMSISSCSNTTVRHMASYEDSLQRQPSVLILPPQVEVSTFDAAGAKERMYDYEGHIEDVITQEMMPVIQAKGFKAKVLRRKDIHDQKLMEVVARLREGYHSAREELYTPVLWEKDKAFSITHNVGSSSKELGEATHSNLILVTDYVGLSQTSGTRVLGVMLDLLINTQLSAEAESTVMVLGIIDAKTGNIVWANHQRTVTSSASAARGTLSESSDTDAKALRILLNAVLTPLLEKGKG